MNQQPMFYFCEFANDVLVTSEDSTLRTYISKIKWEEYGILIKEEITGLKTGEYFLQSNNSLYLVILADI